VNDFRSNIWRLQAQLNTEGLIEALSSDDPGIRRRAAVALRALDAYNAIPALEVALDVEADPEVRASIVAALDILQQQKARQTDEHAAFTDAQAGPSAEIAELIDRLKSGDPEEMITAARALGELGDKAAVESLVIVFNYPRTPIKVRFAAAEALIKLESAPVEVALLGALRSDEWRIRRNGAAILGQLQADWAVEALSQALKDEHEVVRKTAFAALKHIGTPEAHNILKRAARSKTRSAGVRPTTNPGAQQKSQAQTDEDLEKLVWPRRHRRPNPTLAPTKRLDPAALEELRKRPGKSDDEQRDP
jgi:HEAT repeat protein